MSDIWKYFKNWFQSAEESSASQPYIHELIERTSAEQESYARWKNTLSKRRLLDWLREQYVQYLVNPKQLDEDIDFLATPSTNGFVIHFSDTPYKLWEIEHFFDYLKEKVLELNYRSYVSDTRTYTQTEKVETVQRHYLKPRTDKGSAAPKKFQQRFGNITIELLQRNEAVVHLKFSATAYQDHKFEQAADFKDLMQTLW